MSRRSCTRAAAVAALAIAVTAQPAQAAAPGDLHSAPLPFLWSRSELLDVAADGSSAWVAGYQGAYCVPWVDHCGLYSSGNPVVRRWTGSAWKEYPLQGWSGQGQIGAVVTAPGETWIAGGTIGDSDYYDYLARFDGTAFQKIEKPSANTLDMLSTGPAGTWVAQIPPVGSSDPQLFRRTGSTWTPAALPADLRVNDVQARTATDVWTVGWNSTSTGGKTLAAAHFDGTTWTRVATPATDDEFVKVLPVAANDVYALTWNNLAHWNGTTWTLTPLPQSVDRGADLVRDASGDLWISKGHYPVVGNLLRYSNNTWHDISVPGTLITDVVVAPGTSTIWGVGRKDDNAAAVTNS
ncbi:hypothetical protein J4573_25280 [Actinomadura barringtoniae]|uniref:Galactose oxidase n=1 Tax=Actinomadura barringtoniae TaxID=1427535 RepID=A0A939PD65_9ACTN|nr:hypothetical protein [Actinomadura barringtoniae]MBO2450440.1 hypothetical protein [Actinomadura barringtoniae]